MKTKILIFAVSFLLCFLFSCNEDKDSTVNNTDTSIKLSPEAQEVFNLVNKKRIEGCKCGGVDMPSVPALILNAKLIKAAQVHSEDMDKNKFLSNKGSDGSTLRDRLVKNDYLHRASGQSISDGGSPNEIMQVWMNDKNQCERLMNIDFKEIGLGSSGLYWTLVFATLR